MAGVKTGVVSNLTCSVSLWISVPRWWLYEASFHHRSRRLHRGTEKQLQQGTLKIAVPSINFTITIAETVTVCIMPVRIEPDAARNLSYRGQDETNMPDDSISNSEDGNTAKIRESIDRVDLARSLSAPIRQAIDDLLEVAQQAVGSLDASVLVRDGREGGLKFLVAVSELEEALLKVRIPPGKGIAGLVFSSAQPMAVNDVSAEGSFWTGADEAVGFKTVTLLATPLRTAHETIGVLEFVNRPGDPPYSPFTPEEMDVAARFADAIARLVDYYELAVVVESLFAHSIKTGGDENTPDDNQWLDSLDAAPEHRDLVTSAVRLRDIVSQGDAEREMLREVLDALARFTEKRSASADYFNF